MKSCSKCKQLRPFSDFSPDKRNRDGFQSCCKPCYRLSRKEFAAKNPKKIKAWRDATYERNRDSILEKNAKWRFENKERVAATRAIWLQRNADRMRFKGAEYREANRERINAQIAEWRARNPDRAKEAVARWHAAHPDSVKRSRRKYAANNVEKIRESRQRWLDRHPEYPRLAQHNRAARKRVNGGRLSKNLVQKLHKLQRGKCACCGKPLGKKYHLDHQVPIALGGPNVDGNMQLLRALCNLQKSARDPVEFMQSRGFLI